MSTAPLHASASTSAGQRVLVIIPTYNEIENLPLILKKTFDALPAADVLVVDDGSPDGTGQLADNLSSGDPRIHVIHRAEKNGLGPAYLEGFSWGLARGYDVIIEMDADGSHPASRLPSLVDALNSAAQPGLAIGSRWVAGGTVVNWPKRREFLSRGANVYARLWLGVHVHDSTAGFRAFRADVLRAINLESINSHGYCFQIDMTLRVVDAGFTIVEVPIEFRERTLGESKMSQAIILEAMSKVTLWGVQRGWRRLFNRSAAEPILTSKN